MFRYVSCHTGTMSTGEQVVKRRAELGLSRAAAAKLAGVDPKTLQSLEQDTRWPHDTNRAKIERALRWAPGSLDAIRDGGEPTELAEPAETVSVEKPTPAPGATDGVGELRQAIRDLDSLPGYVQRVVLDQAVDELPRAIAALDDERRGRLVRYAFALWDEMGGVADVDAAHGSFNQRGDAGRADHAGDAGAAGVAGDSATASDPDSGDGVSDFDDHREGA